MSKSRGNVIRPEHVINGVTLKELNDLAEESWKTGILSKDELKRSLSVNAKMFPNGIPECGADALRLTLCGHNIKSQCIFRLCRPVNSRFFLSADTNLDFSPLADSRISFNIVECRTNNHFCNKIWQATRYILRMTNDEPLKKPELLTAVDRWIFSRLSLMVMKVNDAFEEKHFYKAVQAVKQFFHYELCDFYLVSWSGFRCYRPWNPQYSFFHYIKKRTKYTGSDEAGI